MLNKSETIAAFITPVTEYGQTGKLQRIMLKQAVVATNDSLAAVRLLALLNDTDISALLMDLVYPMTLGELSTSQRESLTVLQTFIDRMAPYHNSIRLSISESKDFLPLATVEALEEYDTDGSPIDQIATSILVIMAANLQG